MIPLIATTLLQTPSLMLPLLPDPHPAGKLPLVTPDIKLIAQTAGASVNLITDPLMAVATLRPLMLPPVPMVPVLAGLNLPLALLNIT